MFQWRDGLLLRASQARAQHVAAGVLHGNKIALYLAGMDNHAAVPDGTFIAEKKTEILLTINSQELLFERNHHRADVIQSV